MEKQIKVSLLDGGINVNYNDYNSTLNLNLNDSIIEYEKVFKIREQITPIGDGNTLFK